MSYSFVTIFVGFYLPSTVPYTRILSLKNTLNIRIKTEPSRLVQIEATVFARPLGHIPDIYRCNHSSSDRLRFYTETRFIFGTVYFSPGVFQAENLLHVACGFVIGMSRVLPLTTNMP